MSVDLMITQKGLFKKPLPLSVIIGDRLGYGNYDDQWRLEEGRLGDAEFTAFLPEVLARGFTVFWSKGEKQEVMLRLLTPTGREEIREFYRTVERIMGYWNASLEVEGEKVKLSDWLAGMEDHIDFNTRGLHSLCQQILEDQDPDMTLFSALWPLTIGKEEARRFLDDIDAFEEWLADRQHIDAYFASPRFFLRDGVWTGFYMLGEGIRSIFPTKPSVPYGIIDPKTNELLKCDAYRVSLYCPGTKETIGELPFETFRERVPAEKTAYYDGGHCLLSPFTRTELETLLNEGR